MAFILNLQWCSDTQISKCDTSHQQNEVQIMVIAILAEKIIKSNILSWLKEIVEQIKYERIIPYHNKGYI